ncbi:hypothetical protein HYFRA_00003879 [Hymenoscyphus fraxineus]|uniref:Uncharacterized protein n=1 Tax=Hymenoscyphus fraxineus TaxID=746836 RepID=A0A9N9L1D2_9HELO|nr:hypothetical protein HYFRA_00003879 [Hymenoscyphus fraxineus]
MRMIGKKHFGRGWQRVVGRLYFPDSIFPRERDLIEVNRYTGSLYWNFIAFLLPALYSTLSKLWVANIDSNLVVTTDVYTYIQTIAEVLNEGLPRTAWLIIGDNAIRSTASRLSLSYTLILFQILCGTIMTVILIGASDKFADTFLPVEVRKTSLTYVRISAPVALSSAIQVAVSSCTRALDQPDVSLVISSIGFLLNIILDLLLISRFHVGSFKPTILMQAGIRLSCDFLSALTGLCYFFLLAHTMGKEVRNQDAEEKIRPQVAALKVLLRPAVYTFIETIVRNGFYLWLVAVIINMGKTYATAWGVFNTIRWGVVMVPVNTLQASALTFVGHRWSAWHARVGAESRNPVASWADIKDISRPAVTSALLSLAVEVPICIFLSIWGIKPFAYYLSASQEVAEITQKMWRYIDWTYIFYALSTQLSALLLATVPRFYLYQSLGSNFLWMLPWAIVMTTTKFGEERAWMFYAVIFGGALVIDFLNVGGVVVGWELALRRGRMGVRSVGRGL